VVPDLEAYERFLLGTLLKIPGVKDVRSHFAIRTVKPPAPCRSRICQVHGDKARTAPHS
jgi:DNA-binding Lrp family transcriptional regulator